jgi:transposase
MDETGWRQEQRRAWLWSVVTGTLTMFRIDPGRGGAVVEALVGLEFTGVGSDRWSAYKRFLAERQALCWAHLKRAFQGLVDCGGELVCEAAAGGGSIVPPVRPATTGVLGSGD